MTGLLHADSDAHDLHQHLNGFDTVECIVGAGTVARSGDAGKDRGEPEIVQQSLDSGADVQFDTLSPILGASALENPSATGFPANAALHGRRFAVADIVGGRFRCGSPPVLRTGHAQAAEPGRLFEAVHENEVGKQAGHVYVGNV